MKKHFFFGLLACMVVFFTACQDQVQQVAGTYSYKISGTAIVNSSSVLGNSSDTVTLSDEIGSMELIPLDSTTAMVTFNALNGPAYTTQAEIHGKELSLKQYERELLVQTKSHHIQASGEGTFYDNTLIISLHYVGEGVRADQLTMLCKKN